MALFTMTLARKSGTNTLGFLNYTGRDVRVDARDGNGRALLPGFVARAARLTTVPVSSMVASHFRRALDSAIERSKL